MTITQASEPEIASIMREIWSLQDELDWAQHYPLHEKRMMQAELTRLHKRRAELTGDVTPDE